MSRSRINMTKRNKHKRSRRTKRGGVLIDPTKPGQLTNDNIRATITSYLNGNSGYAPIGEWDV